MDIKIDINNTRLHITGCETDSIVVMLMCLFKVDIKTAEEMTARYYIDQFEKLDEIKNTPKSDLIPILVAIDSISDLLKNAINSRPKSEESWKSYNRIRNVLNLKYKYEENKNAKTKEKNAQ